jgi:DNA repair protein RadC
LISRDGRVTHGLVLVALVLNKTGPGQSASALAAELVARFGGLPGLAGVEASALESALAALRSACQRAAPADAGQTTVFVLAVGQSERL